MSSTITIGFLDRTRVCIQTDFTAPLADDERRELLIHAALLTGRAFASLPPDRQRTFAGVLQRWDATRFETCPLQIVVGDPMACPHRFASTFLAPVREYALATIGCNREAGGIAYFLPMAAAAYLRQLTVTDRDPEELFRPALALCAAATIHPITVDNHFQMAAASLPKIGPVVDRTVNVGQEPPLSHPPHDPLHHLRETRRSLIVSACLAALMIVLGVQYFSTREPTAGGGAPAQNLPVPAAPPSQPVTQALPAPPSPQNQSVLSEVPPPQPLSPQARAYLRQIRDLAENSLAQVEVMVAATDRAGMDRQELAEALDYGSRRLQAWRRQFAALRPPRDFQSQHQKIGLVLKDLGGIAQTLQAPLPESSSGGLSERLSRIHGHIEGVLNEAEGG